MPAPFQENALRPTWMEPKAVPALKLLVVARRSVALLGKMRLSPAWGAILFDQLPAVPQKLLVLAPVQKRVTPVVTVVSTTSFPVPPRYETRSTTPLPASTSPPSGRNAKVPTIGSEPSLSMMVNCVPLVALKPDSAVTCSVALLRFTVPVTLS